MFNRLFSTGILFVVFFIFITFAYEWFVLGGYS